MSLQFSQQTGQIQRSMVRDQNQQGKPEDDSLAWRAFVVPISVYREG
jgi:hypothetical protein